MFELDHVLEPAVSWNIQLAVLVFSARVGVTPGASCVLELMMNC